VALRPKTIALVMRRENSRRTGRLFVFPIE